MGFGNGSWACSLLLGAFRSSKLQCPTHPAPLGHMVDNVGCFSVLDKILSILQYTYVLTAEKYTELREAIDEHSITNFSRDCIPTTLKSSFIIYFICLKISDTYRWFYVVSSQNVNTAIGIVIRFGHFATSNTNRHSIS